MNTPRIHQIFYDGASRQSLDPGFTPLDNSANERPDWFEFHVIRDYLLRNKLAPDTWYGFFSPKLMDRTGIRSGAVHEVLRAVDPNADVTLFSHGWDQIAYFLNPFEQGEFWHPGITELTQQFLDQQGIHLNLRAYVAHSGNWVFSNFLCAKQSFWEDWRVLANAFFNEAETGTSALAKALRGGTEYGNRKGDYPMKTFIQERLCCVLLATGRYRIANPRLSEHLPVLPRLFAQSPHTRRRLSTCDSLKIDYLLTRDEAYMDMYEKVRASIPLNAPLASPFL